ncbi:MAG: hypothetical protein CYPHOPRED_003265 [Cyphobasidiales sp. Tagirdzhanova-0007]|nr:MAG: hypothetical protein CYPHOPRED_003265 [Cyphobasidiales sp. Tagirdzhanova-0007]
MLARAALRVRPRPAAHLRLSRSLTLAGIKEDHRYSAHATSQGARADGLSKLDERQALELKMRLPKAMGGSGGEHNPEELLAMAWSTCFLSALAAAYKEKFGTKTGQPFSKTAQVKAEIVIGNCTDEPGFKAKSAKAIKAHGLLELGYEYIAIDDCWQAGSRDANTKAPREDPHRFPNGMKDLVSQLHDLGFKAGIYSSAGTHTCQGRFGSLDFESIDAQTYAEWGFDLLKYDNCYNAGQSGTPKLSYDRYKAMSDALMESGRTMWEKMDRGTVTNIIEKAAGVVYKAKSSSWPDLDGLEVGNGGMSIQEYRTQFSLWALVKSPLMLGNDVTKMDMSTLDIITNKHVIAINQDPLGTPGYRLWKKDDTSGGSIQLWKGNLSNGTFAMLVVNSTPGEQYLIFEMQDFFVDEGKAFANSGFAFYDLWADAQHSGNAESSMRFSVAGHGVRMFRVVPMHQNKENDLVSY